MSRIDHLLLTLIMSSVIGFMGYWFGVYLPGTWSHSSDDPSFLPLFSGVAAALMYALPRLIAPYSRSRLVIHTILLTLLVFPLWESYAERDACAGYSECQEISPTSWKS